LLDKIYEIYCDIYRITFIALPIYLLVTYHNKKILAVVYASLVLVHNLARGITRIYDNNYKDPVQSMTKMYMGKREELRLPLILGVFVLKVYLTFFIFECLN